MSTTSNLSSNALDFPRPSFPPLNRSYFSQDVNTHSLPQVRCSLVGPCKVHIHFCALPQSVFPKPFFLSIQTPPLFQGPIQGSIFIKHCMPVCKDILYLYTSSEFRDGTICLNSYLPVIVSGNQTWPYTLFCICQCLIQC